MLGRRWSFTFVAVAVAVVVAVVVVDVVVVVGEVDIQHTVFVCCVGKQNWTIWWVHSLLR